MRRISINEHLYSNSLGRGTDTEEPVKINKLKSLLKERELDEKVFELFPLEELGNLNEKLRIKGAKKLINKIVEIEEKSKKNDFMTELENVDYIGLTDKNNVILNFPEKDLKASGVYNFTYDFFNDVFGMGTFYKNCLEREMPDLIRTNIDDISSKYPNEEYKYRIININNNNFLRTVASKRYNYYDNNLALYFSLYFLHKYAKENNTSFVLEEGYITDSSLIIFFEQEKPFKLKNIGNVYFGLAVTNSEIKESKLYFENRYRIVDEKHNSFTALPDLKDSVVTLQHTLGLDNFAERFKAMNNLKKIQESMLDYIADLKVSDNLSSEMLYYLLKEITNSRRFKKGTKDKFEDLYDNNMITNSLTLIEGFDKIKNITSNLNEQIYLERIYHDLITELTSAK